MRSKRWISAVLCMLICVCMLPATVFAAAPTTLYVNGTDILTAVDNRVSCGAGTAEYDADSNTLTLDNATLEEPYNLGAIFANGDLTIQVIGDNTINLTGNTAYGFQINGGSVTIKSDGSGSFVVNGPVTASNGNITVDNCRLEVTSTTVAAVNALQQGTTSECSVIIQNGADVTVNGGAAGIYAYNDVVVSGSSLTVKSVHATVNELGIYGAEQIKISDSTVVAEVPSDSSYQAILGNTIEISGSSDVKATGGIRAYDSTTITPATGSVVDVKVGTREDGEKGANHFLNSPYSESVVLSADDGLSAYTYAHIQKHTHVFDQKIADDTYKKSDASCFEPAEYYYSCLCGAKGTETFSNGEAAGHTAGTEWKSDETSHWKECTSCGTKLNQADHTFAWVIDRQATATQAGAKHQECTVCKYAKAAVEIPATGTTQTPSETDQPTQTPSASEDHVDDVPKTGDSGNMALWICLFVLACGGLTGIAVYARKRKAS